MSLFNFFAQHMQAAASESGTQRGFWQAAARALASSAAGNPSGDGAASRIDSPSFCSDTGVDEE